MPMTRRSGRARRWQTSNFSAMHNATFVRNCHRTRGPARERYNRTALPSGAAATDALVNPLFQFRGVIHIDVPERNGTRRH